MLTTHALGQRNCIFLLILFYIFNISLWHLKSQILITIHKFTCIWYLMFNIIIYFTTKQFYTQCYSFIEHVNTAQPSAAKTSKSLSIDSAVTSHGLSPDTTQNEKKKTDNNKRLA